jgi:hypothetical protein
VHQDRIQARRIEQEEQSKAGLSDIDGNWQAPHKFHNDGKEIYFGFSDFRKGGGYDGNKILLLRFVSSIDLISAVFHLMKEGISRKHCARKCHIFT